ncbi:hypothetical protein J6590_075220 [Homalodisca vitripennis]|nr:hypothetical protein J6590_075220 [Homalodisca vitripennis]
MGKEPPPIEINEGTKSQSHVSLEEGEASSESASPVKAGKGWHTLVEISKNLCAMFTSHMVCHDNDCQRNFLPEEGGDAVATLTKESIHHHGCTGLVDQWYLFREGLTRLREHEPEKLLRLELLFLLAVLVVMLCLLLKKLYTKKSHRQSWLTIQQFPYLKISGLKKPEEVSYIKIDTPEKV